MGVDHHDRIDQAVARAGIAVPGIARDGVGRVTLRSVDAQVVPPIERPLWNADARERGETDREGLEAHQSRVPELVQALVEEGLLEFVRGKDAHEVAVAEFVDGDESGQFEQRFLVEAHRGEERFVLHPARLDRVERRHHRRRGPVRIRAQRAGEVVQRFDGRIERLARGPLVLAGIQDSHRDERSAFAVTEQRTLFTHRDRNGVG